MRLTLFHGSDDGFTFIGVIVFLLILMLLVPAVSALLAGKLDESRRVLNERRELYEERQAQLDESASASIEVQPYPPLTDVWKTAGEYLIGRAADLSLAKRQKTTSLSGVSRKITRLHASSGKTGDGL